MFSLVIPCHSCDLKNIRDTVDYFMKEIKLINQLIIIFNNIKNNDYLIDILNKIQKYKIQFDYKVFRNSLNPGKARNASYDLIKSEYVVFHDADDEPHYNKLCILKHYFINHKIDQIHHLFQPIQLPFLKYNIEEINYKMIDNKDIFNYQKKGSILLNTYSSMPVSHGLIAIKTDKLLEIEWNNLRTGEDRDFITKSINNNNKIMILEAFLSKYDKLSLKSFSKYHKKYYKLFD